VGAIIEIYKSWAYCYEGEHPEGVKVIGVILRVSCFVRCHVLRYETLVTLQLNLKILKYIL